MKQRYPMFAMMLLFVIGSLSAFAQRTVSGRVTDTGGNGMPGVNVIVKGTSVGTSTDATGRYSLSVDNDATTIVFSFIGYGTQEIEVGNRTSVDVTMTEDTRQLGEVVVTALGVQRETKALGFSVTQVQGEAFQDARTNNLGSQLSGRIAGVNATSVASGPAGSSRVIIRGNKSLLGNNQPLYVVDGVPMDNSQFGQAGLWGGADQGDGMTSINPDDIESITVLKGANAAALYGARAANGVINIVTKSGAKRKGIGIDFTSNFVFERVNDLRDYQKEFGQGNYVRSIPGDNTSPYIAVAPRDQTEGTNWNNSSWGPRLGSGTFIAFDGVERPYVDAGDNFKRFFQTGYNLTNTLALAGGSESQNFRISLSDLRNTSIVPNTGFDRTNATLSTSSKFGKKLTFTSKIFYSHEFADNRTNLSDSPNNAHLSMYYIPANVNVDWYRGDPNKLGAVPIDQDAGSLQIWGVQPGWEVPAGAIGDLWHQNPWWVAYQFDNDDTRDRVIGSGQARYELTDWLWMQGRVGMDWYTRRKHIVNPQGTQHNPNGGVTEEERRIREINIDWMLGADKTFGKITLNAFVGGQTMRNESETMTLNGTGFSVPFFQVINNTAGRTWGYGYGKRGINSLFASATLGYNDILFLTATGRKDWFSVLNPETNSVFYPSIGGSFVFSDAFELPSVFSFGKLRASWARVGNATINSYSTNLTYSLNGNTHLGYTMASFSSAGGQGGTIPNPNLVPLESTEIEFGLDLRFLDGRIGADLTYYSQRTTKDILNATISRASGFGYTSVNLGEMTNKGIEVLLTATPVTGPLTWDVSLNLAKNTNEVVSLIEGNNELLIEEPRSRNVFIKHMVGYPFGTITGRVQKLSPDGQPVFLSTGRPVQETGFAVVGNGVPDLTGGLMNTFTFKNISLSALLDFKFGGDIFSGTNNRLTQAGFTKMSLQGREGEDPLVVKGVIQSVDGSGTPIVDENGAPVYEPFEKTLTPQEARSYWGDVGGETNAKTDLFVYDASFIKLRQVTLGYSLPRTILEKTPIRNVRISFIGRNLAILHKNTPNIDPESGYSSGNGQGLEYFGFPATRSYGFDLKVQF